MNIFGEDIKMKKYINKFKICRKLGEIIKTDCIHGNQMGWVVPCNCCIRNTHNTGDYYKPKRGKK